VTNIFKVTTVLILAVLILAGLGIHVVLDRVIQRSVEDYGSRFTHSSVTVDEVQTSFLSGTAQIKGFVVGNPPGFTAPTALKIRKVRVRVDRKTVLSDALVIEEVAIDAPDVTFEGSLSRNNLSVLNETIRAANPATGSVAAGPLPPSQDRKGRKVVLRDLRLTNGHVTVWLPGDKTMAFTLPDLRLTDLGTGSGGAAPQELAGAIAQALQEAVTHNVAGVGQLMEQGTRSLGQSPKELSRSAEKATSNVLGGFTGLFQKK
jgi:hypothetical protein